MNFHDKLKRKVSEMPTLNKAEASRNAGLEPTAISSYLSKPGSIPRADIALKIAKAIVVPVGWLIDDSQDWPPPVAGSQPAALMSDDELMTEVSRRYRLHAIQLVTLVMVLEKLDWAKFAASLYEIPLSDGLPDETRKTLDTLAAALNMASLYRGEFDPHEYAMKHNERMPTGGFPPRMLNTAKLIDEWYNYAAANQPINMVEMYARWRNNYSAADDAARKNIDATRLQFLAQIRRGMYTPDKLAEAEAARIKHRAKQKH